MDVSGVRVGHSLNKSTCSFRAVRNECWRRPWLAFAVATTLTAGLTLSCEGFSRNAPVAALANITVYRCTIVRSLA